MRRCKADRECKHQKQAATRDTYVATESLIIWEGLPGEPLSGSECSKARLVLDMKYQTCLGCYRSAFKRKSMQAEQKSGCAYTGQERSSTVDPLPLQWGSLPFSLNQIYKTGRVCWNNSIYLMKCMRLPWMWRVPIKLKMLESVVVSKRHKTRLSVVT